VTWAGAARLFALRRPSNSPAAEPRRLAKRRLAMKANDVISHVLPQFFPAHWLDPPGLVFSYFPSRIRVGYVIRGKANYSYLCDDEFSALSLTMGQLHSAALKNLARLESARITIGKVPEGAEGWISATDDNFAAIRILLPEVQEILRQEIGEEFLVSIPHRDWCFCWSPAQPADRQETHVQEALADFMQEPYNLTPDVFLFSQGDFRSIFLARRWGRSRKLSLAVRRFWGAYQA